MASFVAQLQTGAAPAPCTLWGLRYELTRKADFRNQITTQASESLLTLRLEAAPNFAWASAWLQAPTTAYPLEVSFASPQGLEATTLRLKAQQAYCVGVRLVNPPLDPAQGRLPREMPPPLLEMDIALGKETAFDLGLKVVAGPGHGWSGSDWQASYDWAGQGIFHWKKQQWPVEEYSYAAHQDSNTQGVPCGWPQGGRLRVRLPVMGLDSLLHNLGQKPRRIGDGQTGEEAHLEVTLGQGRVAYTLVMRQTNVLSWILEYGLSDRGHGTLGSILVLAAQEEEVVQGSVVSLVAANLASTARFPLQDYQGSPEQVTPAPLPHLAEPPLQVWEKGSNFEQGGSLDEPYFEAGTPHQTTKPVEGQGSPENCAPIALKMILDGMGYGFDTRLLEEKSGFTADEGTDIAQLPEKFYWWGHADPPPDWKNTMQVPEQALFSTQQLVDFLGIEGASALVSVNNGKGGHAVVVDAIKEGKVFIRDPLPIRRIGDVGGKGASYSVPLEIFESAWLRQENKTKGKAAVFIKIP